VTESFRVAHLDDLERLGAGGGLYRPIRRRLGVRAFGVNAYTAEKAGDQVFEPMPRPARSSSWEMWPPSAAPSPGPTRPRCS
jgi:hypothetical protein